MPPVSSSALPGAGGRLRQGARVAALLCGGSLLIALLVQVAASVAGPSLAAPLAWPPLAHRPTVPGTWSFVLLESSLLPHRVPGTDWRTWGAGSLLLTTLVLAWSFRLGRDRARSAADVAVLAAPSAAGALAVTAAGALATADWQAVPLGPLAAAPVALAALAGMAWRRLREAGSQATLLRALMAAAYALPLALAVAAPAVVLAPASDAPAGPWLAALLPYAPNAVLRGALDGVGAADAAGLLLLAAAAAAIATQLSRRSAIERAAYAGGLGALLTAATVASTPAATAGAALHVAGQTLPAALLVGILGAAAGPYLGLARWGHALESTAIVRHLGDRLPAPAAAEIRTAGSISLRRPEPPPARPGERAALTADHVGRLAAGTAAGVAALIAATVAFTVLTAGAPVDGIPEAAAAEAYLEAAGAGDATRAWNLVAVDGAALPAAVPARLLDRDALARMYALEGGHAGPPQDLRIDVTGREGAAAAVRARFTDLAGAHDLSLRIVRRAGAYRVLVAPAGLALPASSVAVFTVDGARVGAGAYPVAVLPGKHEVAARYPPPFLAQKALVEAVRPYAEPAAAPVGAELDEAGMAAARAAVGAAVRACMAAVTARPPGCPQSIEVAPGTAVRWAALGDAAQSLVVLPDDRGGVVAHGQFEAVGAYDVHLPEDVRHVASGGAFRVPLTWSGGAWSAAGAVELDGADVPRPPVTDAQVLEAVRAGFARCAASTLLRPADCPQTAASQLFVRDVGWKLAGDPLAGAVPGFDARRGILFASGRYSMTATYQEGGEPRSAQSSGAYRADLFWDGRQLVLVAISRTG